MKAFLKNFIVLTYFTIAGFLAMGQVKKPLNLPQLFGDKKLTVYNRNAEVTNDAGKNCIVMDERLDAGIAWINDLSFSSGTIEIDLKGQDVEQKSFLGIAFHGAGDTTYDAVYFRPFNFRSADSAKKIHQVQYVSHPVYTWQKLRKEKNGIYEKAVHPVPDPDGWFHFKIVVTKKEVLVYVNDADAPSLTVTLLDEREKGKLGLWAGDGSGGKFANLSIKEDQ
jgi:hypothetical protein